MASRSFTRASSSQRRITGKELKVQKLKSLSEEIVNVVEAEPSPEDEKPIEEETEPTNYRKELFFTFFNALMGRIISARKTLDGSQNSVEEIVAITDNNRTEMKSTAVLSVEGSSQRMQPASISSYSAPEPTPSQMEDPSSFERITTLQGVSQTAEGGNETKGERIEFTNGNTYEGETNENLMHGTGTFIWNDGTIYEGQFIDGYPTGIGRMVLPDLSVYEGNFGKGYFHGEGVFNLVYTTMIYKGTWRSGKKHGHGWLLYGADNWYEGEWVDDYRCGKGFRRFENGDKYKGDWSANRKEGNGKMVWANNDYYSGEWLADQPHGYGEYTWELIFNKSFCFPLYNWYKGTWHEGVRNGIGVMNFGTECGSKYAGSWDKNRKHGPGVVVCGNGQIVGCNPLFENDKPVNLNSRKSITSLADSIVELLDLDGSNPESSVIFQEIMRKIESKKPYEGFETLLLAKITKIGMNSSPNAFLKLCDSTSGNKKVWCPLEIGIHTVAEEVDLRFYIGKIYDFLNEKTQVGNSPDIPDEGNTSPDDLLKENSNLQESEDTISGVHIDDEDVLYRMKQKEETLLKNFLIINLPELTKIYNVYASFTKKKPINFKPVMIRLFLWQLLRDLHIHQDDVSLVETDEFLSSNTSSCVESVHNPFEPIYFYQYLQSLVGCSWLLFLQRRYVHVPFTVGCVVKIFKEFLKQVVHPNAGKFTGAALTEYLDVVPIAAVYRLYCSVGNPVSVRAFINATCVKKGTEPPCYRAVSSDYKLESFKSGFNAVQGGQEIYYVSDLKPDTKCSLDQEEPNPDSFCRSLYTFRSLGRRIILRCLRTICPRIFCENRLNVNWSYELTFLEFYEAILKCVYAKAEETRKNQEKHLHELMEASAENKSISFMARSKDKQTKRKKSRKSLMGPN